jgi:hypothetical protein
MNTAIQRLITDTAALKITLDEKIVETNTVVDNINSTKDVDATTIILNNLNTDLITTGVLNFTGDSTTGANALSDRLILRGKDLLLIADQTDQFICIATDSLTRVIDVFLHINAKRFNFTLLDILELVILKQVELLDYLESRALNLTAAEVLITSTTANALNNEKIALLNSFSSTTGDFKNIIDESMNVLDIFQKILAVNSSVGVALSVTKQAWSELAIMNTLQYEVEEEVLAPVNEVETVNVLSDSFLLNSKGLGTLHLKFLKYIPQLFLNSGIYKSGLYSYVVLNEQDSSPLIPTIPTEFEKLLVGDINLLPRNLPIQLEEIFGYMSFVQNLDTSDVALETYYDTLISPIISLIDFKALFVSDDYLSFINGLSNGLDSTSIPEFIEQYHNRLNVTKLNNVLDDKNISRNVEFQEEMFLHASLFDGTNTFFNAELVTFIQDAFNSYNGSFDYLTDIEDYKVQYRVAHLDDTLRIKNNSGKIKIKEFIDDKLTVNISDLPYKYITYSDDLQIYYAEVQFGDMTFVIKGDTLRLVYVIDYEGPGVETILLEKRTLIVDYKISGYLINSNDIHSLILNTLIENNIQKESDLVAGLEANNVIDISLLYDDVLDEYNIVKDKESIETTTTYISEDAVDRISTNVTNAYRQQLIDGNIDYSQARTRSIISALRHLKYRQTLEDFIDLTWTSGIPHPTRLL